MSTFDAYHKWLGIPKAEQPPHHYRLLGLSPFESDRAVIEQAARRQAAFVRECSAEAFPAEAQALLDELSAARACLLDRSEKQAYDAELKSRLASSSESESTRLRTSRPPDRSASWVSESDEARVDDDVVLLPDEPSVRTTAHLKHVRQPSRGAPVWLYVLLGAGGVLFLLLIVIVGGFAYFTQQMRQLAMKQFDEVEAASDAGGDDEPRLREAVDLRKLIDLKRDTVRGNWRFEGETLVTPTTEFAVLQIPVRPTEAYVLTATVEASSIQDCLVLGLVVGTRQVTLAFNGYRNTASGLQVVDRKGILNNETKTGPVLVPGRPNHIVCRVTPGRIEVTCDDKVVVNWAGDFKRLLAGLDWGPPHLHQFYIGSYLTSYRISQLDYRPILPTEGDEQPSP